LFFVKFSFKFLKVGSFKVKILKYYNIKSFIFEKGAMSGWFTKSTTLVNDTEYKVIIIDHDNTRDLKPGTS